MWLYQVILFLYTEPDTGWTALHVAVTLNSESIVSQLLELGASNSVQDIEVRITHNVEEHPPY